MDSRYSYLKGVKTYNFKSKKEIIRFVRGKKIILIAINAEKILNAKDSILELINNNIGYADGVGAVWALRKHGFRNAIKIPGCELWLDIIRDQYKTKSFYLVGSKSNVIYLTAKKLNDEYPGIDVVNFRDGYIRSEEEKKEVISDIKKRKPDIVFVATGSPKQEFLMKEMLSQYPALYMGLGGSFDVYTNHVKRAPKIFISLNLEWLYRVSMQPKRLNRLIYQIKFLFLLLIKRI